MIKRVKPFWKRQWLDNLDQYMRTYDFWEVGITEELEAEILKMKPRKHALVVDSTSNAIWMCLWAWHKKWPNRNEVIFPNWGYPAVFKACKVLGLKPVPVDMRMDTLGMNPYGVEKALNEKTLAVAHIETNGVFGDPESIKQLLPEDVLFIEDAAPSILQEKAGMIGDVSMFSFSPTKPFCVGQGSVILMDDTDLYEYLKQLRHTPDYKNKAPTLNFMLSPYLIALLLPQLRYSSYIMAKRGLIHIYYKNYIDIFEEPKIATNFHGSIMYFSKKAERIYKVLHNCGIQTRYEGYPCYSEVTRNFPVSHYIRKHLIDLPIHMEIEEHDVRRICQIIKDVEK